MHIKDLTHLQWGRWHLRSPDCLPNTSGYWELYDSEGDKIVKRFITQDGAFRYLERRGQI